ncbi:hypothetical protein CBL_05824 [Carabus blaptoides fortunei]
MLKLTLLCLFVIQVLSIQAKTYDEVVEHMQPLFQHYHNTIYSSEMILHDKERITLNNMGKYLFNTWYEFQMKAEKFLTNIKNESMTIITELGMTSHMDKIQHCIADMNNKSSQEQNTIVAGADVCRTSGGKNLIFTLDTILKPLYENLTSTHKSVEGVKEICSSYIPDQALICITNILYRRWDPQIEAMEIETSTATTNIDTSVNYITISFNMCNEFVEKKLNETKPILDDFRKCVQEVANNMS